MGTSKSGRYPNTKGSARKMSDFSLLHSSEGRFTKPQKGDAKIRLAGGGHGQDGMDLLDKYGIPYNIEKTFSNGVRVGNIPSHKDPRKRKSMGQTWFPSNWSNKTIRAAAEHVASLNRNKGTPDGKIMFGMYKGVRVGVIKTNGIIGTAFPDKMQPTTRRRK